MLGALPARISHTVRQVSCPAFLECHNPKTNRAFQENHSLSDHSFDQRARNSTEKKRRKEQGLFFYKVTLCSGIDTNSALTWLDLGNAPLLYIFLYCFLWVLSKETDFIARAEPWKSNSTQWVPRGWHYSAGLECNCIRYASYRKSWTTRALEIFWL